MINQEIKSQKYSIMKIIISWSPNLLNWEKAEKELTWAGEPFSARAELDGRDGFSVAC